MSTSLSLDYSALYISQLKLDFFQPVLQTRDGQYDTRSLYASLKPADLTENLRALSELRNNNFKISRNLGL